MIAVFITKQQIFNVLRKESLFQFPLDNFKLHA